MSSRRALLSTPLLFALACTLIARAHDTPIQLPPPQSSPEAWNVIEQSKSNIDQLIDANLMRDIGAQLLNISAALQSLSVQSQAGANAEQISRLTSSLLKDEAVLLRDTRKADDAQSKTRLAWSDWCKTLGQLQSLYPADMLSAEVYICPMHPFDRHLKADEKCTVCGMSLVRRRLPASAIYQKPGEPTLKMAVTCPALVVGKPVVAVIHLAKADGAPVRLDDLLEVHTKKIHLLINDHSLGDYHHEHPEPTDTAGDYRFTFTPQQPGPYRIWADVVPASSGVQEYDIADLPADTSAAPIADRQTKLSTLVDGRRYALDFPSHGEPIRAGQTVIGTITITNTGGKPCTSLEPVMGAFAHLVGFSEDGKSVLHIHPYGKDPISPDDRSGPVFAFKFYAPAPGFLRLYCQVRIGGQDVFAPFNLNITASH